MANETKSVDFNSLELDAAQAEHFSLEQMRAEANTIGLGPELTASLLKVIELSTDAIIGVDEKHRIVFFNHGAEEVFGHKQGEIIGRSLDVLLPVSFIESHRRQVQQFAAAEDSTRLMGKRMEIQGLRKNGDVFPAEASITKWSDGRRRMLIAILRDITKRKELELLQEERFKDLADEFSEQKRRLDEVSAQTREANQLARDANISRHSTVEKLSASMHQTLRVLFGEAIHIQHRLRSTEENSAGDTFSEFDTVLEGHLANLLSHGSHALHFLDGIIQLVRIDSGNIKWNVQPFEPADLITYVVTVLQKRQKPSGVFIKQDLAFHLPTLVGDLARMRQFLAGFVLKVMHLIPSGNITFRARQHDGALNISVLCEGLSLSSEKEAQLLKSLADWEELFVESHQGFGLELLLCIRLIQYHGGHFELRHEGELCDFAFFLPL